MDASQQRLPSASTYTELSPRLAHPGLDQPLEIFKQALLNSWLEEFGSSMPPKLLHQTLNEAEALSFLTPFPALFLPTLAQEKMVAARAWAERQRRLLSGPEQSLAA